MRNSLSNYSYSVCSFTIVVKFGDVPIIFRNTYIILDGLEGDTRIYCPRCQQYWSSGRRGQYCWHRRQFILVSPEKEPSIIIIIIHIGLCVSSYYLTIVSDCRLPFWSIYKQGNIQVTLLPGLLPSLSQSPGNNNIIVVLVKKRVEHTILFWPPRALYG